MRLKGRSTGGVAQTPPVPQSLCTKAFPKKTGGGEVFFKKKQSQKSWQFLPIAHIFCVFSATFCKNKGFVW
jgi:hypothetical protein